MQSYDLGPASRVVPEYHHGAVFGVYEHPELRCVLRAVLRMQGSN
jgi:hypothetical protein